MMKIGTFSKKYNISFYTIRFYIKEGLLLPAKKNNQYYFDIQCEEDMMLILELRECMFSVKEISKFMSIKRVSRFQDAESQQFIRDMMISKREQLISDVFNIQHALDKIDMTEQQFEPQEEAEEPESGVPIDFLHYMRCPQCGNNFQMENSSISGELICSGTMTCSCGYSAKISNGKVMTNSDESIEIWYTMDALIKLFSAKYLSVLLQSYSWMFDELRQIDTDNKVVLCNGENGAEFLYQYIKKLGQSNLYIITDESAETIHITKMRMDKEMEGYKILYIVCEHDEIPIEPESIDVLIDDGTSFYDMFNSHKFYLEKVRNVLKKDAVVLGFYPYYSRKSLSLKNIKILYPQANIGKMGLSEFHQSLKDNHFNVIEEKAMEAIDNPGTWAKYHTAGESLNIQVYHAVYADGK